MKTHLFFAVSQRLMPNSKIPMPTVQHNQKNEKYNI